MNTLTIGSNPTLESNQSDCAWPRLFAAKGVNRFSDRLRDCCPAFAGAPLHAAPPLYLPALEMPKIVIPELGPLLLQVATDYVPAAVDLKFAHTAPLVLDGKV